VQDIVQMWRVMQWTVLDGYDNVYYSDLTW